MGKVEREGGTMTGILPSDGEEDDLTLLGLDEGLDGVTNALNNAALWPSQPLPLLTPFLPNILPLCMTELSCTPETHASPIP